MATLQNFKLMSSVKKLRSSRYLLINVTAESGLIFVLHFALFFLAILIIYIRGFIWGKAEPFNSIMPSPVTRFGDFFGAYDLWAINKGFGGIGYGASYFPGLYVFVEIFYLITKDIWFALKLLCIFYVSIVSGTVLIFLRARGLATSLMGLMIVLVSYPSLFAIHTGNLEMLIFVIILLGAIAAHAKKWRTFAFLIGVATSAKVFPGIFALAPFVLASPKVALRTLLLAIRISVTFSLFALFFMPGGLYSNGISSLPNILDSISESQAMYSDLMVTGVPGLHFGHSLLNGLHAVFGMEFLSSNIWAYPMMAIGLLWTLLALFLIRKLHPPIWMVFGFLGSSGCIFAPTSTDYKLLYLVPAIALYFRDNETKSKQIALICLLVFAISPKPYWYVGTDAYTNANVWLTPISLLVFQFGSIFKLISNRVSNQSLGE